MQVLVIARCRRRARLPRTAAAGAALCRACIDDAVASLAGVGADAESAMHQILAAIAEYLVTPEDARAKRIPAPEPDAPEPAECV
ncbi:hypothetical protein [Saccharopolyspora hattusasensis]|uniref:hypothetical protein n=1 Tax=Saccharopolyspora hattusasensis TaxID=1128679 RepID=UPI003D968C45